jgi:hypothetical protein
MLKCLAILGLLVFGLVGGAWSQVPGNGGQQEKDPQKQQDNAKPVQPTPPVIHAENATGNQTQESSEKPSQYPLRELYAPANVPNWLLVVVAGVAGWLAFKTLTAIKKQAEIMETQANDARESGIQTFTVLKEQTDNALISAKAATLSAMAAGESAKAANDQIKIMKQKERARLSVSKPAEIKSLDVEVFGINFVTVEIENLGYTRAFNVSVRADADITESNDPKVFEELRSVTVSNVIKPDSDPVTADSMFVIVYDTEKRDQNKPNLFIHVQGKIQYEDVFEETHFTTFRYMMTIDRCHPAPADKVTIKSYSGWQTCGGIGDNLAT